MIPEWKQIAAQAIEAGEDFTAICDSIKKILISLSSRYRFYIGPDCEADYDLSSPQALDSELQIAMTSVRENFLADQRRSGGIFRSFTSYVSKLSNREQTTVLENYLTVRAWSLVKGRYLEVLCLLVTLGGMESEGFQEIMNVFGKVGPLSVLDEDQRRFIWTQPTLSRTKSGLRAQPDIVITDSDKIVDSKSIHSIIECKCVRQLGAKDIRAEFGKAHDLSVASYTILSYYARPQSLVEAAKILGLDFEIFGLHTKDRSAYLDKTKDLAADLSATLETCKKRKRFVHFLEYSAEEARGKILPQD